ncbi:MAG: hypothetical protein INH43_12565 [Acidobacteriaceae bacterium]|nr:hypothetical protein [Acidobacteriaceae bacterium]
MIATPDTHARGNADNWLIAIRELVAALDAAYDVSERDGTQYDIETAQTAIHEAPLSVEVRSGWYRPCDANPEPEEYRILLTWGGPAAQITGQLDTYGQPDTARLEYQNWATPWTARPLTNEEREDVLTFAQQFYYGE